MPSFMVAGPRISSSLLAAFFLCQAFPASSAVTISLRLPLGADTSLAQARIADLLESPEKQIGEGLVRYRAPGWSEQRGIQSRRRALAELEATWGEALEVREDELLGAPTALPASSRRQELAAAGQAALAMVPASWLAGRYELAYDGQAAAVAQPMPGLTKPASFKKGDPASPALAELQKGLAFLGYAAKPGPYGASTVAAVKAFAGDKQFLVEGQPADGTRITPALAQAIKTEKSTVEFEDAVVVLIDELAAKDPALLKQIRAEENRIRAIPSREARAAAVNEAYPALERALDRSAAAGKLSPAGAAKWGVFRAQAQQAIAEGTLFERAQFAGRAFDDKVQALLDGTTTLDPDKKLPEKKGDYLRVSQRLHDLLAVPGNSTNLKPQQLDRAFELAGSVFDIRPEFLKYMAKTESGLRQTVPSNPAAAGIMQVENVHKDAYSGARNVANDTITNIVYGALLRAQTDRAMARRFVEAGIAPPKDARVVEFLGDLAYNRGPGLLVFVARHAAEQRIDVNVFGEYLGGPRGSYTLLDGGKKIVILPGPGTKIDKTGKNSVLELSSEDVGRVKFSKALTAGLGDRNGDGRVDHLDVWLTRGVRYFSDPKLKLSKPGQD